MKVRLKCWRCEEELKVPFSTVDMEMIPVLHVKGMEIYVEPHVCKVLEKNGR